MPQLIAAYFGPYHWSGAHEGLRQFVHACNSHDATERGNAPIACQFVKLGFISATLLRIGYSPDNLIDIIFMKLVRAPFNQVVTLFEISCTTDLPCSVGTSAEITPIMDPSLYQPVRSLSGYISQSRE
jgi:hypothetical protein